MKEDLNQVKSRLRRMIVEALMLEDVEPDDIDDAAPLFGTGLGLDSIDALELAIAVDSEFGVKIKADDERNKQTFASVDALAGFIHEQLGAAAG